MQYWNTHQKDTGWQTDYINFPKNYGELQDQFSNYKNSKVAVLPVPYEKTTTYLKGTEKGPRAILDASANMELFDEELNKNISEIGICTLNELKIDEKPELMVNVLYENVKALISGNKFPVILGGEHSITSACVKAFAERYEDFSVLQLDAHADLREEYENSRYSHACAMKRSLEFSKSIVQVGIRSISHEEAIFARENSLDIFWAKDTVDNDKWFDAAIEKLNKNVYITLDLDVLDPSIMPSTGTPEPGGFGYYSLLKFLKEVCKKRNIVGFDVVELKPSKSNASCDFTAAKIIYKLIGYNFFKG